MTTPHSKRTALWSLTLIGAVLGLMVVSKPGVRNRVRAVLGPVLPAVRPGFDETFLTESVRPVTSFSGLAEWTVVDAFPETKKLWGAMQMRAHPFRDDVWFVATFKGYIYELTRTAEGLEQRKVLDIASEDVGWMFSFAMHPRFGTESDVHDIFYVFYHSSLEADAKFLRVSAVPLSRDHPADRAGERVLIEESLETHDHVGGALEFDGAGFLLVSVGDVAENADSAGHSQRLDGRRFSGILRIDVDRRGGEVSSPPTESAGRNAHSAAPGLHAPYFIPHDNPFFGQAGVRAELWSIGYRNPFRMTFDAETKKVWVGEVGSQRREQIEIATSGSNHLWSFREGSLPFERSRFEGRTPVSVLGRPTLPFFEYPHVDQDYCVVGGIVYRGEKHPQLRGYYIYGDYQSGRIFALNIEDPTDRRFLMQLPSGKQNATLTSISTDHAGRIFFTHMASPNSRASVHELVRGDRAELPPLLSQTGYFRDHRTLAPAFGFRSYDVNSPLWSDGLAKRRWVKLPPDHEITNSADELANWEFPEGTVFLKHFANPADENRPIETRVLLMGPAGRIFGASYVWDEEGNDAHLNVARAELSIHKVPPGAGVETEELRYRIPSANDCLVCHNPDNPVLGLNALQLNGPAPDDPGANQLVRWSAAGLLKTHYTQESVVDLRKLTFVGNESASLEARARSYLHSNCSFCHYPEGTRRPKFDARSSTLLADAEMIAVHAHTGYVPVDGEVTKVVVDPGSPETSALYRRLRSVDDEVSMPYLGRRSVDTVALDVVRRWIEELTN